MGVFNYHNPLIVFMVRIANMMIVSFYWVLCCIPVITVLPASAALYHCVTRVVMGSGSGVTRDFFRAFKGALKPGVALSAVIEAAGVLVYVGIRTGLMIWDANIFGAAYMALGVLICVTCAAMLVFVPPVLSRFEGGMSMVLRLSLYFSGRNLIRSLWYAALLVMGIWAVDFFPLLLLVVPALYTDLIRGGVEKIMTQYIKDASLLAEEEPPSRPDRQDDTPTALELERLLSGDEEDARG